LDLDFDLLRNLILNLAVLVPMLLAVVFLSRVVLWYFFLPAEGPFANTSVAVMGLIAFGLAFYNLQPRMGLWEQDPATNRGAVLRAWKWLSATMGGGRVAHLELDSRDLLGAAHFAAKDRPDAPSPGVHPAARVRAVPLLAGATPAALA
jgi:hypothetical protein